MLITVVTIFPEMFPGALAFSLPGKALGKLWDLQIVIIRDFALDSHNTVDDTPYGGGAGMVMKADVVDAALTHALSIYDGAPGKPEIIFMTPRGTVFSDDVAREISGNKNGMIILCGRYEGVDQRVVDYWKEQHGMREISIGDYVLFGGELPAMVVIDACLRFVPGIMGNATSTEDESFTAGLLEYPQYTKPAIWRERAVPDVLLSGNHGEISSWRVAQSQEITRQNRPDLWEQYVEQ